MRKWPASLALKEYPAELRRRPLHQARQIASYDFQWTVRQSLFALGLSEARTSTLVSEAMLWSDAIPLRLRNPLGEDQAFLRTSLLPGLLAALERNIRYGATIRRTLRDRQDVSGAREPRNTGRWPL